MKRKIRWALVFYDIAIYVFTAVFIMIIYPSSIDHLTPSLTLIHILAGYACVFIARILFKVYEQIWRYAGPKEYIRMIFADAVACLVFVGIRMFLPHRISFVRAVAMIMMNLLGCIAIRLFYQLIYQKRTSISKLEKIALKPLYFLMGTTIGDEAPARNRIKIAIIGAGSVGAMLADELIQNPKAAYEPVCFVDIDKGKTGREICGIPVLAVSDDIHALLDQYNVQEVVFALPNISAERRKQVYEIYQSSGYKVKSYDYPTLDSADGGKRRIRDFDIEDLLFRSANQFLAEETMRWYSGKNVLITGGGGSIGSELARQIAKCSPAKLVLLDVYENGAYEIQQELIRKYGEALNLKVEIANICDREQIETLFQEHMPDIVLHAAAHKHVPLMERNVIEAVKNNVFGTLTVVNACEKFSVRRLIMISTDKAVNPTNVMGATKRMCEMIVQSRSGGETSFSATRFGNVLGSNGSVIPLFKQQIASGGPITITDKRIIRYFMTIPEACQLVMTSGFMARNGELYALNMGKPVKILDLAESMIRLSGLEPYKDIDIVEVGLRPGEKLFEELLIKSEELDKTDNEMIFIERDKPLSRAEIDTRLDILRRAVETNSNTAVREALRNVVPTYQMPEEINRKAVESEEMKTALNA